MRSAQPPAASHPPGSARCRRCSRSSCSSTRSRSKRSGVVSTRLRARGRAELASREQASAPSHGPRRQIAQIDAEHVLDAQAVQISTRFSSLPAERLLTRSEVGRVDAAGRDPGEDVGDEIGKHARQVTENPDLVRGTGTAAGEHESQIRPLMRNAHSLCRKGLQTERRARNGSGSGHRERGLSA